MRPDASRLGLVLMFLSVARLGAEDTPGPAPATLPSGARARLSSTAVPGSIRGFIVRNDAESVTLLLENLGEQRVPVASLTRLDISVSKKRQWLKGAAIGVGVGLALGFALPVDSQNCDYYNSDNFCSRGEAVLGSALAFGFMGTIIGGLVQTDRWTAVDLEALRRSAAPVARNRRRPVSFQLAFRF